MPRSDAARRVVTGIVQRRDRRVLWAVLVVWLVSVGTGLGVVDGVRQYARSAGQRTRRAGPRAVPWRGMPPDRPWSCWRTPDATAPGPALASSKSCWRARHSGPGPSSCSSGPAAWQRPGRRPAPSIRRRRSPGSRSSATTTAQRRSGSASRPPARPCCTTGMADWCMPAASPAPVGSPAATPAARQCSNCSTAHAPTRTTAQVFGCSLFSWLKRGTEGTEGRQWFLNSPE